MGLFAMILNIAFMILGVEPTTKFPPALTSEEDRMLLLNDYGA